MLCIMRMLRVMCQFYELPVCLLVFPSAVPGWCWSTRSVSSFLGSLMRSDGISVSESDLASQGYSLCFYEARCVALAYGEKRWDGGLGHLIADSR